MPNQQQSSDAPHLPRSAPIEAYGKGGFAFADMSHRGSLLCLPDAIWAWPVTRPAEIDEYSLARVFKAANAIDTLIVGTGTEVWLPPRGLREALRAVQRGARRDADRACDPHLQHHAGRAPARRGGADRGAMSGAADAEGCRRVLRRSGAHARFCPLCVDAVRAGRSSVARCWRSTPSMSRYRACASRSASLCRAKCGCNGGPTCWPAPAMAASRAIRSRPNCCWRSGEFAPAGRAAVAADRGASVRSLQRSDADRWRRWRAMSPTPRRRCFRSARGSRRGHRTRSIISRAMPGWPRAWRR